MANLLIDIGNTALKAAWADGMTLGRTFRYQGERMLEFILSLIEKERPEIIVLSSVRRLSADKLSRLEDLCDHMMVMNDELYDKMFLVIDMKKPRRKPNRIAGYDYSQSGAYFVTICTQDRKKILSKISVGTPLPGCPPIHAPHLSHNKTARLLTALFLHNPGSLITKPW